MTTSLPPDTLRRIIGLATRAPSFHNSQPWRWRATGDGLELHADRDRQLRVADPVGRNLVISCGSALHHLQVAAGALGWGTEVHRVPDQPASSLLAHIELRRGPSSEHAETDLRAIDERCTDRRRFTSWPVPEARLTRLAEVAAAHGTRAVPLVAVTERFRAELLVGRAVEHQSTDQRIAAEQQQWAQGPAACHSGPRSVGTALLEDGQHEIEASDGLVVLCDRTDDVASWLSAGEGLSALWLTATTQGLSVVPLSQVVEVDETRLALQHVLGGLAHPLILVRIGWQEISRSQLPRSIRRPVDDVLDLR